MTGLHTGWPTSLPDTTRKDLAAATTPTTKAEAYLLLEDFAEKCQLPDIKKAVADVVASAPVKAAPAATNFSLSAQPSRIVLPPVIVIGAQP